MMQYGYWQRGTLRRVRAAARGAGSACRTSLGMLGGRPDETRRTPWLAAGCNKPATFCAEKAVEVVRNHEGGTGVGRAVPVDPMGASVPGSGRVIGMSVEGGRATQERWRFSLFRQVRGVPADAERYGACKAWRSTR